MIDENLYDRLEKAINETACYQNKTAENLEKCKQLYGVPESVLSDYIYGRSDIRTIDPSLLYPLAAVWLDEKISSENYKYKGKKTLTKFEPVIQVSDNQWITTISVHDLIDLYDSGRIRYNPETQRPMKRTLHGNTEVYRFYKNDKAIAEMCSALKEGSFIPNTITINVLKDGFEGDISANFKRDALEFKDIDHFDLLDGYHRFLALKKIAVLNPSFEFTMELRITNFTLKEAHQFIFQEDQKTKMTKVQSASYNTNDIANQVVGYLKKADDIGPLISRNGGIIDEGFLSIAISDIYIGTPPRAKGEQFKLRNEVAKELEGKLFDIISSDPSLLNERWDRDFIIAAIWCCKNYKGSGLYNRIKKLYEDKGDLSFFVGNRTKGKAVNFSNLETVFKKGGA